MRAFWRFLKREFGLANADGILRLLNDALAKRIDRALSNPATFGMAKSFVMMGKAAGFDTTSEDGIQEWVAAYNAGLPGHLAPPVPPDAAAPWPALPSLVRGRSPYDPPERGPAGHSSKPAARRKMARDSRRKNRRKK
jgi:hypothetical protein